MTAVTDVFLSSREISRVALWRLLEANPCPFFRQFYGDNLSFWNFFYRYLPLFAVLDSFFVLLSNEQLHLALPI